MRIPNLAMIAAAVGLAGCTKHEAAKSEPAVTQSGAPAKPAVVAVVAVDAAVTLASGSGSGSGLGSAAAPPVEAKAVSAAFRAAMKRGRKATDAKDYDGAIAAFDEALKARANDPHAIAERGFAKLLAGKDLPGASGDFDHAADLTHDPKLLSMIWFNRGLTDEKLGNANAALTDYYLANQLLPSKAAAGKLVGKQVCPLRVAAPAELSADPPLDATDWLALAKAMDVVEDLGDPKTSEDARKAMVGQRDEATVPPTKLPTIVDVGGFTGKTVYVVGQHGTGLRAIAIASEPGGRCEGSVGVGAWSAQGDLVYARVSEDVGGAWTRLCGDDHHDCKDDENENQTGTACDTTPTTLRDVVVDLASGKRLLSAEQQALIDPSNGEPILEDARLVKAAFAGDGLHLSGLGCDQVIPVAAK